MCLIVIAVDGRPDLPLIVAANRDEFFARPTRPAQFWPEHPQLLAGQDLEQGGTWLGVTCRGRFAALTNYRDGRHPRAQGRRSRGLLVRDFLLGDEPPAAFLARLRGEGEAYDGFNLLFGQRAEIYHHSNRAGAAARSTPLAPGVYGLSNHLLDTPWPKVERAKQAMRAALELPRAALQPALDALLRDDAIAHDDDLPDTGVSRDWERLLSSAFIRSPSYGTRASTAVLIGARGEIEFSERSFAADEHEIDVRAFRVGVSG